MVNSLSATSTLTSLTSGSPQLQLFVDGNQPITGALTSTGGSQTTGLAGRISVNGALVTSPGNLVAYSPTTTAGDATRPNFMLSQINSASLTYSASTGLGRRKSRPIQRHARAISQQRHHHAVASSERGQ